LTHTHSHLKHLQCFDAVGWAAGRASGRKNLSDEVLAWSSVWSEVQITYGPVDATVTLLCLLQKI